MKPASKGTLSISSSGTSVSATAGRKVTSYISDAANRPNRANNCSKITEEDTIDDNFDMDDIWL